MMIRLVCNKIMLIFFCLRVIWFFFYLYVVLYMLIELFKVLLFQIDSSISHYQQTKNKHIVIILMMHFQQSLYRFIEQK